MTIGTIADVTPGGSATALSTGNEKATWIIFTATGTSIRVGDSNVASGRGVLLQTGVSTLLPVGDFDQGPYDLAQVFVYGSGGDKVSITYGS